MSNVSQSCLPGNWNPPYKNSPFPVRNILFKQQPSLPSITLQSSSSRQLDGWPPRCSCYSTNNLPVLLAHEQKIEVKTGANHTSWLKRRSCDLLAYNWLTIGHQEITCNIAELQLAINFKRCDSTKKSRASAVLHVISWPIKLSPGGHGVSLSHVIGPFFLKMVLWYGTRRLLALLRLWQRASQ